MVKIAIIAEIDRQVDAKKLAHELNLPLIDQQAAMSFDYLLRFTNSHLELCKVHSTMSPLVVDFLSGKNFRRAHESGRRNQLLAKAVGIKPNFLPSVLDCTAGLAGDAYVLASLGCSVRCLERNPVVAALVKDALLRLRAESDCSALQLTYRCESLHAYLQAGSGEHYDTVYVDPMFPERSKSALVKKDMRMLHDIVGMDPDSDALLDLVKPLAKRRVVVKRPLHAPTLNGQSPDVTYKGKSTRYDVYLIKK
jgi:16S rRNA (guanine1516-N2)-methyltransferase